MSQIIIADDDVTTVMELEEILTSDNYDVVGTAHSGEEAVEMALSLRPDLILMDVRFPGGMDGISAAEEIRARADIPVVFLTGFGEEELIQRAKQVEPFAYVMKPYNPREIRASLEIALYKKGIERQLLLAHDELEQKFKDRTAELAQANDWLNALMNATSDTILLINIEGEVIAANEVAAKRFGKRLDQFLCARVYDLMPPELAKSRKLKARRVIQTGKPHRFEDKRAGIIFDSTIYPVFDEEGTVVQLAVYGKDITKRVKAYNELEKSKRAIQSKTRLLEDANIALKIMLQKSTENRKEVEKEIFSIVKKNILPYIFRLKECQIDDQAKGFLDALEVSTKNIFSSFTHTLFPEYIDLSPKEIEVANLIREGRTTKQISKILNVAKGTIDFHRNNLRIKLGIKNKKTSLKTYLISIQ